ncbi:MAG: hypothetical protein CL409_04345 [Acidimicrobiaceae bacterium]|nr:hypothetical protein [Acidimicrobiaceae bacterium]
MDSLSNSAGAGGGGAGAGGGGGGGGAATELVSSEELDASVPAKASRALAAGASLLEALFGS